MCELPTVTGRQAISAFEKAGFSVDRISASHHIMKRPGHRFVLSVPVHGNKALKKGTLCGLINAAGMTIPDFIAKLD